jgi:hypothetical protein
MSKVQVTSQIEIEFDDVLKGVARLETSELERFAEQVNALRAQRRAAHLPKDEAELLQMINRGVPPEVRQRYIELDTKLHEETITSAEQQELLQLTDKIELSDAERMQNLILLAQLRGISVDALMVQLGISRPAHA